MHKVIREYCSVQYNRIIVSKLIKSIILHLRKIHHSATAAKLGNKTLRQSQATNNKQACVVCVCVRACVRETRKESLDDVMFKHA